MTSEVAAKSDTGPTVLNTFAEYLAANISLDADRVVKYYHEPLMYITAANVVTVTSQAEAVVFLKPSLAALKEAGYARTDFPQLHAKSLGTGLAIISCMGVRYRTDGTQMGSFGFTYLWRQVANEWKLAVLTAHDPSTVLSFE